LVFLNKCFFFSFSFFFFKGSELFFSTWLGVHLLLLFRCKRFRAMTCDVATAVMVAAGRRRAFSRDLHFLSPNEREDVLSQFNI